MAAKKVSAKPKPNKIYYAPSQGAMRRMQEAIHRYDDRVSQLEAKWGVDRLIWLVDGSLRDRFEAQMDRLNKAIEEQHDVEHQVEVTLRGVDAVEKAAIEAGVQPLDGGYIEAAMPDGRVLAVTKTDYEVSKVKKENREMVVFSATEVAKIVQTYLDESKAINDAKGLWPGAVIEKIKTPTEIKLDDSIPF